MSLIELDRVPLRRALISVYDKTGLIDLARALADAGVEIEKVIDRIIVRRDDHPRTRLELLPVHLPAGAQEA